MNEVERISWEAVELPAAIETCARWAGLPTANSKETGLPTFSSPSAVRAWINCIAAQAGFEADEEDMCYRDFATAGARAPLVFQLPDCSPPRFVVIAVSGRTKLAAVGKDLKKVRIDSEELRDHMFGNLRSRALSEIESLLRQAGVPSERLGKAQQVLLNERLASVRISTCWKLRLYAGASAWRHAKNIRLPWAVGLLLGSYALSYAFWILSWWVLGSSVLQGRFEPGWIAAWALLLLTMVPFRLLATWMQGVTAAGASGLLRRKILHGSLHIEVDELRSLGIGHFLGRVIELESIEAVGFNGGVLGITALIELAAGAVVLGFGADPLLELLSLIVWFMVLSILLLRYIYRRKEWTSQRLRMTHDVIERIVGHRTRIVQEAPERWHAGEDEMLSGYLAASKKMDDMAAILSSFSPRVLLITGLFAAMPALTRGEVSTASIAITIGGMLIAGQAIHKIIASVVQLSDAFIAYGRVEPLLSISSRVPLPSTYGSADKTMSAVTSLQKLIELKDICFQHPLRPEPVLRQCSFTIFSGDKLLLEGPSGSGKSTMVSILAGLRIADSGLLLIDGLDLQTVGANGWRRRVALAPQFHDNHVFTESFAFNLLMGRHWPPSGRDIVEAETLCRELGLGELLDRMPAGYGQIVGESGWQLSHGERSRLFIARALLQNSDILLLDESFAALDPDTLRLCVECVLNHAQTLLVIAHR
jgi:ATP-binding cassette subfamily B protein